MSWLDAHESFFIDLVADDRIADLHGSIDAETPSREAPAETPRPVPAPPHGRDAGADLSRWALVKATR